MHLIYIDDSYEDRRQVFSALAIRADRWQECFAMVRDWRRSIKESDGIMVTRELHATEFVAGRGRLGDKIVPKARRCEIFRNCLRFITTLPSARLINVCTERKDYAFERLLNRINRTLEVANSRCILICDQGNEDEYTKLIRKMGVHNPIPSQYGAWADSGRRTRNIPISRVLEDPFFRPSDRSYFVQLADFCAYSLLRKEVYLESKAKYHLHTAFPLLETICWKACNPRDPFGVIR